MQPTYLISSPPPLQTACLAWGSERQVQQRFGTLQIAMRNRPRPPPPTLSAAAAAGKDASRFCEPVPNVQQPLIPPIYSQTACGIKSAVPKSMQARHASPRRWNGGVARLGLAWRGASLCNLLLFFKHFSFSSSNNNSKEHSEIAQTIVLLVFIWNFCYFATIFVYFALYTTWKGGILRDWHSFLLFTAAVWLTGYMVVMQMQTATLRHVRN